MQGTEFSHSLSSQYTFDYMSEFDLAQRSDWIKQGTTWRKSELMKRLDKRLGSRGPAAHSWVFVRRPALPSRWIAALPSYQRNTIVEMRARGESYEDIASTWIAAGASNTAPFSTGGPPQPDPGFLEKPRVEVRAYLCESVASGSDLAPPTSAQLNRPVHGRSIVGISPPERP
jgi:hypothetical protein